MMDNLSTKCAQLFSGPVNSAQQLASRLARQSAAFHLLWCWPSD
jgi:hypothetical protein